jgi:prepilin-type N-terminal cleavage/methylation domain-containing protein
MKKTKKRGFTIVELVIVIAVIAILAAVLIPTFTNISEKANKSSALQAATNAVKAFVAADEVGQLEKKSYIFISSGNGYWYLYNGAPAIADPVPVLANGYTEDEVEVNDPVTGLYELIDNVMTVTGEGAVAVEGISYYIQDDASGALGSYSYVTIGDALYQVFTSATEGYEDLPGSAVILEPTATA